MSQQKSVIHGQGYKKAGLRALRPLHEVGHLERLKRDVAMGYRHFMASRGLGEFESDRFRYGVGEVTP